MFRLRIDNLMPATTNFHDPERTLLAADRTVNRTQSARRMTVISKRRFSQKQTSIGSLPQVCLLSWVGSPLEDPNDLIMVSLRL